MKFQKVTRGYYTAQYRGVSISVVCSLGKWTARCDSAIGKITAKGSTRVDAVERLGRDYWFPKVNLTVSGQNNDQ